MDHPGIVHRVTAFFSGRGANIIELSTDTKRAAHTGAPIFNLQLEVEIAATDDVGLLEEAFQVFCEEEALDGTMTSPGVK